MCNDFTPIVEKDGPWYIAYCAEVPGANGQGKSREECLENLREAIILILDHRREDSLRAMPPDAKQELVVVGRGSKGSSVTSAGTDVCCGEKARNTRFGRIRRPDTPRRFLATLR